MGLRCRVCTRLIDAQGNLRPGTVPKNGDVSICWECETVSVYQISPLGSRLVEPDPQQMAEIAADSEVKEALAEMRRAKSAGAPAFVAIDRLLRRS